jgi:FKBP-type peptidyl-prolyl cis-trans isomerase
MVPRALACLLFAACAPTARPATVDRARPEAEVARRSAEPAPRAADTRADAASTEPAAAVEEQPGGLQVVDLVVGTGPAAKAGDRLRVHYTGTLVDGTKFDSSLDRGVPFVFESGRGWVIEGWERGVPGMRVGGTRRLTIPHALAYGEKGRPPKIPPGATLIFEIELLGIE